MERGEKAEREGRQRRNGQRKHQHAPVQSQVKHDADVSLKLRTTHTPLLQLARANAPTAPKVEAAGSRRATAASAAGASPNRQPHGDLLPRGRAAEGQTGDGATRSAELAPRGSSAPTASRGDGCNSSSLPRRARRRCNTRRRVSRNRRSAPSDEVAQLRKFAASSACDRFTPGANLAAVSTTHPPAIKPHLRQLAPFRQLQDAQFVIGSAGQPGKSRRTDQRCEGHGIQP